MFCSGRISYLNDGKHEVRRISKRKWEKTKKKLHDYVDIPYNVCGPSLSSKLELICAILLGESKLFYHLIDNELLLYECQYIILDPWKKCSISKFDFIKIIPNFKNRYLPTFFLSITRTYLFIWVVEGKKKRWMSNRSDNDAEGGNRSLKKAKEGWESRRAMGMGAEAAGAR